MSDDNLLEAPISLSRGGLTSPACEAKGCDSGSCPQVNIDGPEALKFPEDCLVTFRVKRGQMVVRSASRYSPAGASVTLELREICCVEECEPEPEAAAAEVDDPIDRLFKAAQD